MSAIDVQPENAPAPIDVIPDPSFTCLSPVNDEQPLSSILPRETERSDNTELAEPRIYERELFDDSDPPTNGILRVASNEQPLKALFPIEVTESGMDIEMIDEQPEKAYSPIEVKLDGRLTVPRPTHPLKEYLPILSKEAAEMNEVRALHPEKA